MASDGCQTPTWYGTAFPYLLHNHGGLSSSFKTTLSSDQSADAKCSNNSRSGRWNAATGTWDGPAPKGPSAPSLQGAGTAAAGSSAAASAQETYVLLAGGQKMPLLGISTWKLSAQQIRTALELGFRHLDCAQMYGNAEEVGQGLHPFLEQQARESLFVSYKLWNESHRPEAVRSSCRAALSTLRCAHLDLLLLHWPQAWIPGTQQRDEGVALRDTWMAMESLVDEGLVKHLGLAHCGLLEVEDVLAWSRVKPAVLEVELHPLLPQRKLVGVCRRKGVACVALSPLAQGAPQLLAAEPLVKVARSCNKTPAQVALRWNTQRGVAVVVDAESEEHMREALQGALGWQVAYQDKVVLDKMECGLRTEMPEWQQWPDPDQGGALKPSLLP